MATTIKEFIEYLKTLPPDTEVGVICGYTSGYSYDTKEVPLEIDEKYLLHRFHRKSKCERGSILL